MCNGPDRKYNRVTVIAGPFLDSASGKNNMHMVGLYFQCHKIIRMKVCVRRACVTVGVLKRRDR